MFKDKSGAAAAFKKIDFNGDGVISKDEMDDYYRNKISLSPKYIEWTKLPDESEMFYCKKYDQEANYEEDNNDGEDDDEITPLTTTFYVHRSILASVSTYFQSLFKMELRYQTSEHESQTSTIKLHSQAIKAFPVFLDYLYNFAKGRLGFKRSNAVALRHLAI